MRMARMTVAVLLAIAGARRVNQELRRCDGQGGQRRDTGTGQVGRPGGARR